MVILLEEMTFLSYLRSVKYSFAMVLDETDPDRLFRYI